MKLYALFWNTERGVEGKCTWSVVQADAFIIDVEEPPFGECVFTQDEVEELRRLSEIRDAEACIDDAIYHLEEFDV